MNAIPNDLKQAGTLALDIETIIEINARLARIFADLKQDEIHGAFRVEIVKGRFHRIEVTDSYLTPQRKKHR